MFLKHLVLFFRYVLMLWLGTSIVYAACTPSGTAGDDNVICTGATSGYQEFYGGSDRILLQPGVTGSGVYWLDERNGGNSLTDGNDTFIANESVFLWVFGFNGDDYFEINGSTFSNLYADTNPNWVDQRGDDTIIINRSVSNGWILGGNDADTLVIRDSNVSFVAAGYSDIYSDLSGYIDYTPFDGDDNITLDNVDFNVTNYAYPNRPGAVESGKADDTIRFVNGGNAYSVTGGHGNDTIIVEDDTQFNACSFVNDRNNNVACGIYGDEPYGSEPGSSPIAGHGDDTIILKNGHLLNNVVNGGDGSDQLTIYAPVQFFDSVLDGGDDRNISDGFIDTLVFDGWVGDVNGSNLRNWESVILENGSSISFTNDTISVGFENGTDPQTNFPYGLTVTNGAALLIDHNFTVYGNLHNEGVIDLQKDNVVGTVLTVENDYSAQNSIVRLDVVLNDASPIISDRLVVKEERSGTTWLELHNLNGTGGQTPTGDNAGILLVEVLGDANGLFALQGGSVTVNEYEYTLVEGSNGNWYLQSKKIEPTPPKPTPPCPNPCPPMPCPVPPPDTYAITVYDDSLYVPAGESVTKTFPAADIPSECTGNVIWQIVTEPRNGDVVVNEAQSSYTYVPTDGYLGSDHFMYAAETENCHSNVATIAIAVGEDNNGTGTVKSTPAYSGWSIFLMMVLTVLFAYRNRYHL